MKKTIILLFICVSCGKTALDSPIAKQSSALLSPKEQRLVDCKTQVQWSYNNCMKMFSPNDPVDIRQRRLDTCENNILSDLTIHCDYCDSVDWDSSKISHGRYCTETDYTYHPYL